MKTIVLVEDDAAIREVFNLLLDKTKYSIKLFSTGLSIFNNEVENPDLFILDKNISGINGLDLCRFIKRNEKYANVPVVMLSATPEIKALAKDAGADDAIEKPFSIKEIQALVSKFTSY